MNTIAPIMASLAVLASSLAPIGGASAPQNPAGDALKLSTDLVVLDVYVINKKTGLAVGGLRKDDLVLYEDGAKQYITHMSQDELPLSIVLLLDMSGSANPILSNLRAAATATLARLKPEDEIAVMAFAGSTKLVLGFTTNKELAAAAIEMADSTGLETFTSINEGVYQATSFLASANPQNRRVIIAVTDDVSTQKRDSPRTEMQAFENLDRSEAVVCGLVFFSPIWHTMKAVSVPGSVRTYAESTGGIVVDADKKKLEAKLSQLVQHLRSRYAIGYVSSNPAGDGKFRKLKIELSPEAQKREGKTEIITRKGYRAPAQTR